MDKSCKSADQSTEKSPCTNQDAYNLFLDESYEKDSRKGQNEAKSNLNVAERRGRFEAHKHEWLPFTLYDDELPKPGLKPLSPEKHNVEVITQDNLITEVKHADGGKAQFSYNQANELIGVKSGSLEWAKDALGWYTVLDDGTKKHLPIDVQVNKAGIVSVQDTDRNLTIYPGGRSIYRFNDGSRTDIYPSGLSIREDNKGKVTEIVFPSKDRFVLVKPGKKEDFIAHYIPQMPGSPAYMLKENFKGHLGKDGAILIDDKSGKFRINPDGNIETMIERNPELPTQTVHYEGGSRATIIGKHPLLFWRYQQGSDGVLRTDPSVKDLKVDKNLNLTYTDEDGKHSLKPIYD